MIKKFVKPTGLPEAAFKVWESVFKKNKSEGDDKASKIAWSAVKKGWKKVGDVWKKKKASEMNIPDTFKGSITDLSALELDPNSNKISAIEIMRIGDWSHPIYGDFEMTMDKLERFKENFDSGIRKAVAVDVEHKSDDGAVGWFKNVYIKEDSLFADVEWTPEGIQYIRNKKYRFFSPEYADVYEDAASGQEFMDVLIGGAITNRPFFQELEEIVLSDKTIKTKKLSKKKTSLKKALKINKEKGGVIIMTKEQLKKKLMSDPKFKPAKEDKVSDKMLSEVKAEIKADAVKKAKIKKASLKPKTKKLTKGVKTVSMSEAEVKELREQASLGKKAYRELRIRKFQEDIDGMTFSEDNTNGVLLPKSVESTLGLMKTLNGGQRKLFNEFLKTLPKIKLFGEIGKNVDNDEPLDDPRDEMDRRAKKLMSESPKKYKKYRKALFAAEKQMKEEGLSTE